MGLSRCAAVVAGVALIAPFGPSGLESAVVAGGCTPPAKFSRAPHRPFIVSDADVYRGSCQVARLSGPTSMAREYGVRSSNRLVICRAYAETSFQPALYRPAVDGCVKSFALRKK